MIFITGDTHADFSRFTRKNFPEQENLSKDDIVIIAGDFGGIWFGTNDSFRLKAEKGNLDELNNRPFTTVFVPGNHENYDRLMSGEFETVMWNGGYAKEIRPSVYMLLRGEIYNLDGLTLFAFGGASSHDVTDGILDPEDPELKRKIKQLKQLDKSMYRIRGKSWWEQELPSQEEMDYGLKNLQKHDWKVDCVVTHCAPSSIQKTLTGFPCDVLTDYLEAVRTRLSYKYWYFGHYHRDLQINERDTMLHKKITKIR